MQNLEIYKETKRNAKCPCGSGKIFKRCCMKEYREAKKRGGGQKMKFSTFSPIKLLREDEARVFMEFYDRVLLFSYEYRTKSKKIIVDDLMQFFNVEREYFYENRETILEEFIKENTLNDEESALIESIRDTRYEAFFLLEYDEKRAIISDAKGDTYSVQALTTPFTKLFTKKPLVIQTALVPYKNRYILDGRYVLVQEKMSRAVLKEIEMLPTLGRETMYQKEKTLTLFPMTINLTLFCDAVHYEKMEEIVLSKIPDDFTQKMLDMFKDTPFERISFCSSFIRSMDFLHEINGNELKEDRLFSGLSVSNYEMNGDGAIIPYDILNAYYKQKPLNRSISKSVYKTVQNSKAIVKRGERNNHQASSFYSMLGVFYIHSHDIDEFRFLEELRTEDTRRAFTKEIEKLFDTINQDIDFDITPVFLDFVLDLDEIIDEIDEFRDYMGGVLIYSTLRKMREYSIHKGKKPNFLKRLMKR